MSVAENLKTIQDNIHSACQKTSRNVEEVSIIAVTKYVTLERTKEAVEAGIVHLGENREEGLMKKWDEIKDGAQWHFIGTLQSRKVKSIIDKVSYIHSLDRISLAKEIHKRAKYPIYCFVQVNVSGEESKHGLPPEDVINFIHELQKYSNIVVKGLMTMAPFIEEEEQLRMYFRTLKELQENVKDLKLSYAPCDELSMGMSNDYRIAVEEGATFVRIGTALVGEE
ncbi:YggS family pyridoxal phosphate-dependent enzyme [Bacillus spongiae]|uniref:Pyridoxal phosphate homeostasis protein n=1 Tax=Bacillus spongiae TaxID=2683610 RepID=A0ABU8HAB5_9BACI